MKISRIKDVLNLAKEARSQGLKFTPMFRGGAGLGKSEVVQQWVEEQRKENPEFGFIDVRIAYYESPDLVGFPHTLEVNGIMRTIHALPELWPTEGSGLLLFEEPNRGTTGVMNCLMQILTDRKVGPSYALPKGWMMASCINPDDANYDVNSMDTALTDRFEIFDIDYDHVTFVDYMEKNTWNECIVRYVKSGAWQYKSADSIGKDGKYISPRTWSKLNAAEASGAQNDRQMHFIICQSILGKHVGNEYWKSCWDDAPVTARDILTDKKKALKKLKDQCKPDAYQGDKIAVTVESIVSNYGGWYEGQVDAKGKEVEKDPNKIDENTMAEIAKILPQDQSIVMIKDCGYKACNGNIVNFFQDFVKRHPECVNELKANIRINRMDK
jgi:hypothetical protein